MRKAAISLVCMMVFYIVSVVNVKAETFDNGDYYMGNPDPVYLGSGRGMTFYTLNGFHLYTVGLNLHVPAEATDKDFYIRVFRGNPNEGKSGELLYKSAAFRLQEGDGWQDAIVDYKFEPGEYYTVHFANSCEDLGDLRAVQLDNNGPVEYQNLILEMGSYNCDGDNPVDSFTIGSYVVMRFNEGNLGNVYTEDDMDQAYNNGIDANVCEPEVITNTVIKEVPVYITLEVPTGITQETLDAAVAKAYADGVASVECPAAVECDCTATEEEEPVNEKPKPNKPQTKVGGVLKGTGAEVFVEVLERNTNHRHILYSLINGRRTKLCWSTQTGRVVSLGVIPEGTPVHFKLQNKNTRKVHMTGNSKSRITGSDTEWVLGWKDGGNTYDACQFKVSGVNH